ncbi:MAG TPA: Gfo/Idh/MocA family oxidoreductase [Rhodothermales bacterium]|nr:Gfo/Idh/MocA family oxidoreductase [Rhodothermales bacterium]
MQLVPGLRFGLAGAGVIGQIRARALSKAPNGSLSAVFDVNAAATGALASAHGAAAIERYEDLLGREDVDAVIVSSPPQFHEEQVITALEAGKHVLCEKPLANSPAAARRMVEAAKRTGQTLSTGFNHRYFPAIQFVKQTLESGLIGELDHIRAFAGHQGLSQFRAPWEYDKHVIGGGALLDVGIHMLDLTRYLLGDVAEVYGKATGNVWKLNGSEDNGLVLMTSPAGKSAVFQATWSEWKGYRFHIEAYGTKGMARAYYAPMMSMRIILDEPGGQAKRERNFYPKVILREKLKGWQSTVEQTFTQELEDFVRFTQGERNSTIANGFSGFRTIEIANAVYQSTRSGAPVKLTAPF